MIRLAISVLAAVALTYLSPSSAAAADDKALSSSHAMRERMGRRCMASSRATIFARSPAPPFGEWKRTDRTSPDRAGEVPGGHRRPQRLRPGRQLPGPPRRAAARAAGEVQDPAVLPEDARVPVRPRRRDPLPEGRRAGRLRGRAGHRHRQGRPRHPEGEGARVTSSA